jgi:hypothetical protein
VSEHHGERDGLLREAYKGEVFGDAFFGALAAHYDGERARKLRSLQAIEARTAMCLQPLLDEAGIDVDDAASARRNGTDIGQKLGNDWDGFVRGLHDALPGFLAQFVRLRELAPDPHHPSLRALVAHELTINAFTELELAGHDDLSGALLQRYLETAR